VVRLEMRRNSCLLTLLALKHGREKRDFDIRTIVNEMGTTQKSI
jgi:hypothetical protein